MLDGAWATSEARCEVQVVDMRVGWRAVVVLSKTPFLLTLLLASIRTLHWHVYEQVGNICAITAGHNISRIGTIQHTEKHQGGHNIVHVKDKIRATWATRQGNVFVLGTGNTAAISLPRNKGIKLSIVEEASRRQQKASKRD